MLLVSRACPAATSSAASWPAALSPHALARRACPPAASPAAAQCTRVCGKPLDCGRHCCEQVCHAGPCGPCKLAGPKACPCGKQQLPHAACDVVVPPCGETCGKLLACGVHHCHERCHAGAMAAGHGGWCGAAAASGVRGLSLQPATRHCRSTAAAAGPCQATCRELVQKPCECGKTTRTVQARGRGGRVSSGSSDDAKLCRRGQDSLRLLEAASEPTPPPAPPPAASSARRPSAASGAARACAPVGGTPAAAAAAPATTAHPAKRCAIAGSSAATTAARRRATRASARRARCRRASHAPAAAPPTPFPAAARRRRGRRSAATPAPCRRSAATAARPTAATLGPAHRAARRAARSWRAATAAAAACATTRRRRRCPSTRRRRRPWRPSAPPCLAAAAAG